VWEGSTENATLAGALLSDLVDRGLDPEQAILFVIDGSKASSGRRSRAWSESTRSCTAATATRRPLSSACKSETKRAVTLTYQRSSDRLA
jgi:hypothetical protein